MDENYQDKTGSNLIATENELWLPPLSPKEQEQLDRLHNNQQEQLDRLRNNQTEDIVKKLRGRGCKVTEEYSNSGQLSKISREFPSKKTRWDWAQLLIVPLLIALLGGIFTGAQYLTSLQNAKDTQEEATLKAYLDDMTTLLLDKKLGSHAPADKAASADTATVARAKTLTALHRLTDAQRKARVLQFLYEAHLIGYLDSNSPSTPIRSIINLHGAPLSGADLLRFADLRGANLSGADLSFAYLRLADLRGADLRGADLRGADLSFAYLRFADLRFAYLRGANLSGAELRGADLRLADLRGAELDKTILKGARYNTKEILLKDEQGKIFDKIPPTQWPQGFDPKAAGAREDNTSP